MQARVRILAPQGTTSLVAQPRRSRAFIALPAPLPINAQVIMRIAEPFDQVKPCLTTYQALLADFTDPDDSVQADAA